jgi:hypothetical protein
MVQGNLHFHKEFNSGTVIVDIPDQGFPVDVVELPLPDINQLKVVSIGFHPFRLVTNMQVVDTSQQNKEVQIFTQPIEIRVWYTADDYRIAKEARRELTLGFWDGTRWFRFTKNKHNFHWDPIDKPASGGWGVINVTHWGDPTKSWGT